MKLYTFLTSLTASIIMHCIIAEGILRLKNSMKENEKGIKDLTNCRGKVISQ